MKKKKSQPKPKWAVGDIVGRRKIFEVKIGNNIFGRETIMYGYRYEGEDESEPLLWCSHETLLRRQY